MQKNYNVNEARRIFADCKQHLLIDLIAYYNLMVMIFGNTQKIETKGILIAELKTVISDLPPRYQEYVKQKCWCQYSNSEIGRNFKISRERVRQLEIKITSFFMKNTSRFVVEENILNIQREIHERTKWLIAKQNWLNSIKNRQPFECDITIKELTNDLRVINAMDKSGLKTVGDIAFFSEDEFLSIRGINIKSLGVITAQMQLYFPGWVPKPKKRKDIASNINAYGLEDISNDLYEVPVKKLNFSNRAYNCLMRAGIYTIKELFEATYQELIVIRNLGDKVLHEINGKKDFVYLASQPIRSQKLLLLEEEVINLIEMLGLSNLGEIALLDEPKDDKLKELRERLLLEYL